MLHCLLLFLFAAIGGRIRLRLALLRVALLTFLRGLLGGALQLFLQCREIFFAQFLLFTVGVAVLRFAARIAGTALFAGLIGLAVAFRLLRAAAGFTATFLVLLTVRTLCVLDLLQQIAIVECIFVVRIECKRRFVGFDCFFKLTLAGERVTQVVFAVGVGAGREACDAVRVFAGTIVGNCVPFGIAKQFCGGLGIAFLQLCRGTLIRRLPQVNPVEGLRLARQWQQQERNRQDPAAPKRQRCQRDEQQQQATAPRPATDR